jgi:diguanylate cyclase (GGDEF)-like protein/PAS domain S-box-containing protein
MITPRPDEIERRLKAHSAIAVAMDECGSLAEAAPAVLRALCENLEWDLGAMWTVDGETKRLRCIGIYMPPSTPLPDFEEQSRSISFASGEGLPGRVWASGKPAWVRDVVTDPEFKRSWVAGKQGLHTGMAFPIKSGREVLGVIECFTRQRRDPDDGVLRMMAAVGMHIAQLIERQRVEQALRDAVAHASAILGSALDCIITLDHEGKVVAFNPAAERTFGYLREEALGRPLAELILPEGGPGGGRGDLAGLLGGEENSLLGKRVERLAVRASGAEFPVEVAVTRVHGSRPAVFTVYIRDISERRRAEERLRQAEATFRRLVEQIPAVTYIDAPNDISSTIYISPQIEPLTGYSPDEWRMDPELWVKLLHPDDRENALTESNRTNATGERFEHEYRLVGRDGRTVWVRDEALLVRDERGRPQFWQGVMVDITARKEAEEEIAFLAYHDRLTGLPNRAMFEEILELDLARAKRHGLSVAVLYMDLDNFKLINDSLGHVAGDDLLRQVAARLAESSRETDLVARLGGDEFLLLLSDVESGGGHDAEHVGSVVTAVETVASRLNECLERSFSVADQEVYVSASIGISIFPFDAQDAKTLLTHADAAMYRSKKGGAGHFVIFPAEENGRRSQLSLATRLRRAVEERQWVLHYQPIVHLTKGQTVGVEALIRWNDPERGLVAPSEFLSLAEETGVIEPMGDWVLEELGRQWGEWRAQGLDLEVSFNLSPRQLWQPNLSHKLLTWLQSSACDPSKVIIEITETTAMTDPDRTQQIMTTMREKGVRFAIDDFGTGYSSLSRLKELPVDVLKIDRSFVKDLPRNPDSGTMVRAIIQLARSMGMTPLAEGIETEAQWRFLVDHGCVLGQGYFFSYPMPGGDIANEQLATASRVS